MAMVANMAGCSGCTAMKIPFLYWELRSLSLNFHINVSVSNFYISRIGPHISCSRMQIDCVNIKISTDTRMWKSGLQPRNSFSGNICFEFSVLVLCSVDDNTKNHRLLDILFSLIKTDSRNQYYVMMESGSQPQEMKWVLSCWIQEKPSLLSWLAKSASKGGRGGGRSGNRFFLPALQFSGFCLVSPHISLSAGYRDKKKDSKMEDLFPRQRTQSKDYYYPLDSKLEDLFPRQRTQSKDYYYPC